MEGLRDVHSIAKLYGKYPCKEYNMVHCLITDKEDSFLLS